MNIMKTITRIFLFLTSYKVVANSWNFFKCFFLVLSNIVFRVSYIYFCIFAFIRSLQLNDLSLERKTKNWKKSWKVKTSIKVNATKCASSSRSDICSSLVWLQLYLCLFLHLWVYSSLVPNQNHFYRYLTKLPIFFTFCSFGTHSFRLHLYYISWVKYLLKNDSTDNFILVCRCCMGLS